MTAFPKNMLVIEDDDDCLDYYRDILPIVFSEGDEYNIRYMKTASDALEVIKTHDFDCVILDLMMSKVSFPCRPNWRAGMQLHHDIREIHRSIRKKGELSPIYIISALSNEDIQPDVLDGYIMLDKFTRFRQKPANLEFIKNEVKKFFDGE